MLSAWWKPNPNPHLQFHEIWANVICWWKPCETIRWISGTWVDLSPTIIKNVIIYGRTTKSIKIYVNRSNISSRHKRTLLTCKLFCEAPTANQMSAPLRPCLRRSLSWMKPVNIWVSMNTSKNLLKLLEVTALRKASRWKDDEEEEEGLGEVGEETDSSSRSGPPMKRE